MPSAEPAPIQTAMRQCTQPGPPRMESYRGIRTAVLCDPAFANAVADLTPHGTDYTDPGYSLAYYKQNNLVQNDWSDLIDLIGVLNSTFGHSPANYVNDVQQRLNVEEW